MMETLEPVLGFDLRAGISVGSNQSSNENLGCSRPLVAGDRVHVVLNEKMPSGSSNNAVRNHFASASLEDLGLGNGTASAEGTGRVRSWCALGPQPIKSIHALDEACSTLVYAQGGQFFFAEAGEGGGQVGAGEAGDASGTGGGGIVTESLPVHAAGSVVDFRINADSRDIVSGGDDGHVHVLNFSPDMAGVPGMKVSKYVGCPVSSARWSLNQPYVATWTTPKGHLQMLDTRDYRLVGNIRVDGSLPVHTHEHLSEAVVAVGCESGQVQLFDVRKMSAFLTLQDPIVGNIKQIMPLMVAPSGTPGTGDWAVLGTGGVSRYSIISGANGAVRTGSAASSSGNAITQIAAGMSYNASCSTSNADLDVEAGMFLAPPHPTFPGRPGQLCGITRAARIVNFSSRASKDNSGSTGGAPAHAHAAPADGTTVAESGGNGGGAGAASSGSSSKNEDGIDAGGSGGGDGG